MRTFTKLRGWLRTRRDLLRRLDEMESEYDTQFKVVFDAIRQLIETPERKARRIGFRLKEDRIPYGTAST